MWKKEVCPLHRLVGEILSSGQNRWISLNQRRDWANWKVMDFRTLSTRDYKEGPPISRRFLTHFEPIYHDWGNNESLPNTFTPHELTTVPPLKQSSDGHLSRISVYSLSTYYLILQNLLLYTRKEHLFPYSIHFFLDPPRSCHKTWIRIEQNGTVQDP